MGYYLLDHSEVGIHTLTESVDFDSMTINLLKDLLKGRQTLRQTVI